MLVAGYRVLRRPRALHLEAAARRRGVVPGARRCHVGGAPSGRRCRAHAADQGNTTRRWSDPRCARGASRGRAPSSGGPRGARGGEGARPAKPTPSPPPGSRGGPPRPGTAGRAWDRSVHRRTPDGTRRALGPASAGHHRRRGHGEAESRQLQPPAQVDVLPHRQALVEPPDPVEGQAAHGQVGQEPRGQEAQLARGRRPGIARHSPVERRVVEAPRHRVGALQPVDAPLDPPRTHDVVGVAERARGPPGHPRPGVAGRGGPRSVRGVHDHEARLGGRSGGPRRGCRHATRCRPRRPVPRHRRPGRRAPAAAARARAARRARGSRR